MMKEHTMTYTYDDNLISDLHKDCWGTRPSVYYMSTWKAMTPDQKQGEWEYMCAQLEENEIREAEAEQKAYDAWTSHIFNIMSLCNCTRADAIRYDMMAEDVGNDIGHYCYRKGLAFRRESELANLLAC